MLTDKYNVPEWAMLYLVNGDSYGITEDEKEMINQWMRDNNIMEVIWPVDEDPHFSRRPAFGKACMVYECECVIVEEEPRMTWEDEQCYHS